MINCSFFDYLYSGNGHASVEETEEFVAQKVEEIEKEIMILPDKKLTKTYTVAIAEEIKQEVKYLRSKEFLLAFLRTENFDTRKAALRLAHFLQIKLKLFGPEKLPHRIRQEHLSDADLRLLSSGFIHLGGIDCGGRSVISIYRNRLQNTGILINEHNFENLQRACFYLLMSAIENNEQTQKNGIVVIRWVFDYSLPLKKQRTMKINFICCKMMIQAMPMRLAAIHNCFSNPVERFALSWLESMTAGSQYFLKFHCVSPTDCLSELSKYGINVEALPIALNGEFQNIKNQQELEQMRQKENCYVLSKDTHQLKVAHCNSSTTTYAIDSGQQQQNQCSKNNESHPASVEKDSSKSHVELLTKEAESNRFEQQSSLEQPEARSKSLKYQSLSEGPLPLQLMGVLESNAASDAIWWSRNGTAFTIKKESFEETVLSNYFKGIKMDSFMRKLKRWGFKRLSGKQGTCQPIVEFKHHFFQRDSPHLLEGWEMCVDIAQRQERLPLKLKKMLENNSSGFSQAIWWVYDGKAFAIDKKQFQCHVLEKHFVSLKIDSFFRTLRRWGFNRLTSQGELFSKDIFVYEHPMFQRNIDLSSKILDSWQDGLTQNETSEPKMGNFLMRLYGVISNEKAKNSIWWVNDGNAVAIHMKEFARDILPNEFNGVKIWSFRRSLKRWGFETLESDGDVIVFQNNEFRRELSGNFKKDGIKS